MDQALDLLAEWEKMSTIDINDALQMLSADFTHPKVRMAAARRIAVADDNELVGYLLQLVQALRYEPVASDAPANDSLLNLLGKTPRPTPQIALCFCLSHTPSTHHPIFSLCMLC